MPGFEERWSRRTVLRWSATGGVLLGSGLLSGCGSDDDDVATGSTPSSSPGSAGPNTSQSAGTAPAGSAAGSPVRGGTLRVGAIGGSAGDTLDPHSVLSALDVIRTDLLYDSLAEYTNDRTVELALAEEITPSADGLTWTVRLRDDVAFHDGRPVTAADVVASLRRIIDPAAPKNGAFGLSSLDFDGIRAIDDRTAELTLVEPNFLLVEALSAYSNAIVPADFDPAAAVGTGPFRLVSFTPGEGSVFERAEGYWRQPDGVNLDAVEVIDFADDTAVLNALLSGEIDGLLGMPATQLRTLEQRDDVRGFSRPTGAWFPFTMRVDQAPFDDVRVRQALRLVVDRQQMIDQVYAGQATLGNDTWCPFDQAYLELPQRERDLDEARRLLTEAGVEDLEIELVTTPMGTGILEAAQVFAQQASEAGITVNVRREDTSVYFTESYSQVPFSQDIWDERPLFSQTYIALSPGSIFNPCKWDDERTNTLMTEVRAEPDEARRAELLAELQQIQYDEGGYIVWAFHNYNEAYSTRVGGLADDDRVVPLRDLWLT